MLHVNLIINNYDIGIFVKFKKVFYYVSHDILATKIYYCGIRVGVALLCTE